MDDAEISMHSKDITIKDSYFINDTLCLQEAAEQIRAEILDAKYKLAKPQGSCCHMYLSISRPTREA
jgi:hypothetical protein